MKIYFYLRRTEDWKNVEYEKLQAFNVERLSVEGVRIWWDKVSSVRWFDFRAEMKRIAMSSWKLPILFMPPDEIFKLLEDDDFVIPTDDDDWYHPDLNRLITENIEDAEYAEWNPGVIQTAFHCNFHDWFRCHKETASCGFVIKGSLLRRMDPSKRRVLLRGHTEASRYSLECNAVMKKWEQFNWSMYNWHFGSISAIGMSRGWEAEVENLFPKRKLPPLPSKYEWCRPQYEDFKSLIESMKFRAGLPKMKLL